MRTGVMRPHFKAFLPKLHNGIISVYRTIDLNGSEIEAIGAQYVGNPEHPLKGHCCQPAREFFSEGLDIVSHPTPHLRHANVSGWNNDPLNRLIAKKLAEKASLTIYAVPSALPQSAIQPKQ